MKIISIPSYTLKGALLAGAEQFRAPLKDRLPPIAPQIGAGMGGGLLGTLAHGIAPVVTSKAQGAIKALAAEIKASKSVSPIKRQEYIKAIFVHAKFFKRTEVVKTVFCYR